MSKAILPRRISVEIRKGSKERRKGENGLRLSILSFPCSLAFRHQSFMCPSRFALASVRKTKRLRRRQRLNGKAHSSKAIYALLTYGNVPVQPPFRVKFLLKFKYENVVRLAFQKKFYSKTRMDGHITIREKSVLDERV